MNKDFTMDWDITPCRLTGDSIEEIKGLPVSTYYPFDYYRNGGKELYLQLVAVDESDPQSILKFISTYGFLGIKNDYRRDCYTSVDSMIKTFRLANRVLRDQAIELVKQVAQKPSTELEVIEYLKSVPMPAIDDNPPSKDELDQSRLEELNQSKLEIENEKQSEKLEDIKKEILTMRTLVLLWQAIKDKNREGVLSQLKNIFFLDPGDPYRFVSPSGIFLEKIVADLLRPFEDLVENAVLWYDAAGLLSWRVNEKLSGVMPFLCPDDDGTFIGSWYFPHLLSAMYVMFYMDLTQGVALRKCQNKTCKEFFSVYGGDDRKIYCSDRCAKAHAQREYRRRKKDQELV